ncbi:MAG TPA: HAD family hydrolase [Candidatus Polarisedimenticolia bacterium]|nr:HAD family hydrolase [Candidatus Polarisedimenticolia bacterium]
MPELDTARIRGIVFDLWNTLAFNDHHPNPLIALADAFHLRGRPGWSKILETAMMLRPLPGIESGIEALEQATGKTLPPGGAADLAQLWSTACRKTRFFPDVPPALERLAGRYGLGLLSNTQSFDMEFMDETSLPLKARLFSFEAGLLKPDPEVFAQMAARLDAQPGELLMVGDNLRDDVRGAEAAGMQALLIRRRGAELSFVEAHADRRPLSSLWQLVEILQA